MIRRALPVACALALMLAGGAARAQMASEGMAGMAAPAPATPETLADIRAGLASLYSELRALEAHLAPGGRSAAVVGGNSALQRLDSIEGELQRLTGKTEELEHRISRILTDGTGRVTALERRICALEPGCDPAAVSLEALSELAPALPPETAATGPQLAVDERAAFERGQALLEAGDYLSAEEVFAAHLATWPGGPLSMQAELLRGRALEAGGDMASAARAYLAAFSADKDGPHAAEALTALGQTLAALGQTTEACAALRQVDERFPDSPAAIAAAGTRAQIDCR